jgi:hypothetical protein
MVVFLGVAATRAPKAAAVRVDKAVNFILAKKKKKKKKKNVCGGGQLSKILRK